jgi:beta-mannanase
MRFILPLIFLLILITSCGVSQLPSEVNGNISGDFSGCATGAFVNGMENLSSFQSMAGKNLAVVLWYVHWQDPFPTEEADTVYANGSIPLITWEPWITHSLGTLEAISSGSFETYVREFIQAAKDWGKPLFLRFAHEMNGNWYPWDGFHNGGATGPEKYKQAWIYIYNVREALEADSVYLVWCPNNTNIPDASWNEPAGYYPGDQYVDWIGMDGYNWVYASWQDFDSVFSSIYQSLTALTEKPLMVGEFASAEQGGSKADWIADAFSEIKNNYPRIKLFCWFNINKERDWRINSSTSSEAAFGQAIGDSYFVESLL